MGYSNKDIRVNEGQASWRPTELRLDRSTGSGESVLSAGRDRRAADRPILYPVPPTLAYRESAQRLESVLQGEIRSLGHPLGGAAGGALAYLGRRFGRHADTQRLLELAWHIKPGQVSHEQVWSQGEKGQ